MALFAISDLHLAIGIGKPMDIFGVIWEDHAKQIENAWNSLISPEDTVVIPGDITWAMTLSQADADFGFIDRLPGNKIILKGNHDYWWSSVTKIENYFNEKGYNSIKLLKNNYFRIGGDTLLCGTRGWIMPCDNNFKLTDMIIYKRELGRLKTSLSLADKDRNANDRIITVFHYPPLLQFCPDTEFTGMLEEFGVEKCFFGHVHGNGHGYSFEGVRNDVLYTNISADKLAFKPILV
ncbi:MAG: metallophosphoesterase [Saccharofermentanales bacterium]